MEGDDRGHHTRHTSQSNLGFSSQRARRFDVLHLAVVLEHTIRVHVNVVGVSARRSTPARASWQPAQEATRIPTPPVYKFRVYSNLARRLAKPPARRLRPTITHIIHNHQFAAGRGTRPRTVPRPSTHRVLHRRRGEYWHKGTDPYQPTNAKNTAYMGK